MPRISLILRYTFTNIDVTSQGMLPNQILIYFLSHAITVIMHMIMLKMEAS